MPAVSLYFQMHLSRRLRRYSVFDSDADYFDEEATRDEVRRRAQRAYLPLLETLQQLAERHGGDFRFSIAISGATIELLRQHAPDTLERLRRLSETGSCELLAGASHHGLDTLCSESELLAQIDQHAELIEEVVGQQPSVFFPSGLTASRELIATLSGSTQLLGCLIDPPPGEAGVPDTSRLYTAAGQPGFSLLMHDRRLSQRLSEWFCESTWETEPMSSTEFARFMQSTPGGDEATDSLPLLARNLLLDADRLGQRQQFDSAMALLRELPAAVLEGGDSLLSPSEMIDCIEPVGEYDPPAGFAEHSSVGQGSSRDENAMQADAARRLRRLESAVKSIESQGGELLESWRRLGDRDHFAFMSTAAYPPGLPKLPTPYDSPYDAYINYVNVLENFEHRLGGVAEG